MIKGDQLSIVETPIDGFRNGVNSIGMGAVETMGARHPVELIQSQMLDMEAKNRKTMLANIHGQFAANQVQIEQEAMSRIIRRPGLPSSQLGLKSLLHLDDKFGFEDYLNDPEFREEFIDFHAQLENMQH